MATYFFDVTDGSRHWIDAIGGDHPDERAAQVEAMHTLAQRLQGRLLSDEATMMTCTVRDASRQPLWNVILSLAIERVN